MSITTLLELIPGICKLWRLLSKKKPVKAPFLIVEDNANDADLLVDALARRSIVAEVVTSGEMAAGVVRHTFYPVILLDMRLPGMSGEALLRVFSKHVPHASVVVVCGEPADLATIPPGKFVCVIRKPATLEAIEEMLGRLRI